MALAMPAAVPRQPAWAKPMALCLLVHKIERDTVGAVDNKSHVGIIGAQAVNGLHILFPPDADSPLGLSHPANMDVVILAPATRDSLSNPAAAQKSR